MTTQFLRAPESYQLTTSPEVIRWTRAVGSILRVHHGGKAVFPKIWAYRFDKVEFLNCLWGDYLLGFALQSDSPRLPSVDELFGVDCRFRGGDVPVHDMTDALMLLQMIEQARLFRQDISFRMDVPTRPTEPEQAAAPPCAESVFASIIGGLAASGSTELGAIQQTSLP